MKTEVFVACQRTLILDFFYRPSQHDVARTAAVLELPLKSEIRGKRRRRRKRIRRRRKKEEGRRRRRRRREKVYKYMYIIDWHAILQVHATYSTVSKYFTS